MTAIMPATRTDAAELLRMARQVLREEFGEEDPLVQAAQHLITCAADVAALLPGSDLESAQEALGCARAAVGIAGYVVCKIGDSIRASS